MKVFLFLLMSVLEVRLHAAEFIDQPESCFFNKQYPCAVKNLSLTQNILVNSVSIAPQSIVKWKSKNTMTLIKGSVLIEESQMKVSNIYTTIDVNGSAYIIYDKDMLNVEVYEGVTFINKTNELGPGMQTLIPGFNENGKLIVEMPRPMNYEQSIRNWQKMSYNVITENNKKDLRANIQQVVEVAAQAYKTEVNRQIANYKKNILDRKQRRIQKQKEIEELNNLFKKKNYLLR